MASSKGSSSSSIPPSSSSVSKPSPLSNVVSVNIPEKEEKPSFFKKGDLLSDNYAELIIRKEMKNRFGKPITFDWETLHHHYPDPVNMIIGARAISLYYMKYHKGESELKYTKSVDTGKILMTKITGKAIDHAISRYGRIFKMCATAAPEDITLLKNAYVLADPLSE